MGDVLTLAQAGVTEAPASLTVRAHVRGYDCMVTIRDTSGRDLLAKLGPVLDALDAMGATPNGGNGHANGASNGDDAHMCPVHNVAMRRHEKDGQAWYSHKTDDGTWCRGKGA